MPDQIFASDSILHIIRPLILFHGILLKLHKSIPVIMRCCKSSASSSVFCMMVLVCCIAAGLLLVAGGLELIVATQFLNLGDTIA